MKCFKKACRLAAVMVCARCGRETCERHGDGTLCQMCARGHSRLPAIGAEEGLSAFHDGACRCKGCRAAGAVAALYRGL